MQGLSVLGKAAPKIAAAGGLAAGLAVPVVAGPLISGIGNLATQAVGGVVPGVASTASAMGVGRPGAPNVPQVTASGVPGGLGQFGGTAPYGGTS